MAYVVPAVIPNSFEHLIETLTTIAPVTNEVQIDVVDGIFVPYVSWPYTGSGSLMLLKHYAESFTFEVDLMVKSPETVIDAYVNAGVSSLVVHLESTNDLAGILAHHREHNYRLGLSLLNDTPLSVLEPYLNDIDYVQLMGIAQIGAQGQPFDNRVIERVHTLRSLAPELTISVDGSVNRDTARVLKDAGVNRLISGSAILAAEDPHRAFEELTALVA